MARFVSRYGKYRHIVRSPRMMVLADGQNQELVSSLMAEFDRLGITEEEVQLGLKKLNHRGLPFDRETESDVSARSRISVFDTELAQVANGWSDEERVLVEESLRMSAHIGNHFFEVVAEPAARPWPTYDSVDSIKEIITIARAIGVSLEDVIAYELENADRAPVVNELRAALSGTPEVEDDVLIEA